MRLRLGAIAFLIGSLAAGVCWLTLQPVILRLMSLVASLAPSDSAELLVIGQMRQSLPILLAMDLLMLGAICFGVLHFTVGRHLLATETAVEQLGRLDLDLPLRPTGGPLLSRIGQALGRMAEALRAERELTQKQVRELQAANESLARAQTELVARERLAMVGELAAGVAHEVGNPLAGILGYLSIARMRAKDNPELIDCLDRTEAEVQRIDVIVRGLLDLGKPSRGMTGPVEVSRIIDAVTKLVRAGPDFTGVQLSLDVEPGLVVRGEAGPLSQVLLNLLLNAAQAAGPKGEVQLAARTAGTEVLLEVTDSGSGLSPEVQASLFKPFFSTKAAGKGTGLGLAVSRHLLAGMGGRIGAENAAGRGARFSVHLPRL